MYSKEFLPWYHVKFSIAYRNLIYKKQVFRKNKQGEEAKLLPQSSFKFWRNLSNAIQGRTQSALHSGQPPFSEHTALNPLLHRGEKTE